EIAYDHDRRADFTAALLGGDLVRTHLRTRADRRYSGARSHRSGCAYHQPDRDLPREAGGAKPPYCRIHDQLFYRRCRWLVNFSLGMATCRLDRCLYNRGHCSGAESAGLVARLPSPGGDSLSFTLLWASEGVKGPCTLLM